MPPNETRCLEAKYLQTKAIYESQLVGSTNRSLLENFIKPGKANQRLLSCLLGATLITSALNTLLLSFVVKSIQLNDKGLINGQINWDETSASSVIQKPARLPDKSISLDSIESGENAQLTFQLLPRDDHHQSAAPFLSAAKSNYFANNDGLEIGANVFELDLIGDESVGRKAESFPLFEYDEKQQLISLPLEKQLQLSPSTSGSLLVNQQVTSSEIQGSLEGNLDVQTRGGDLNCFSKGTLKLVSKSADIKMTSRDYLLLRSDSSVRLNSNELFIRDGIELFDAVEKDNYYNNKEPVDLTNNMRAYNLLTVNGLLMAAD